jgi:hypothetical protein
LLLLFFNNLPASGDYDFVKIPDSFSAQEGGMDKMGRKTKVNQQVMAWLPKGSKL